MDGLARTGLNFTDAVSGFPLCCPYRGSLLTSRYPHHCVPGHEYRLPPELPTVAHVFRENGYDTFYLGKWHLDGAKEAQERAATHYIPRERRGGFDSWLDMKTTTPNTTAGSMATEAPRKSPCSAFPAMKPIPSPTFF